MKKVKLIYWRDGKYWLGHLQDYPEYMSQGLSLDELQENLRDILNDINSGKLPGVRKVMEMAVA